MNFHSLRRKINEIYRFERSWKKTGERLGITKGLAYKIAKEGYEPKDPHIRMALGLPALVPAPVCEKCGEIHLAKRCPNEKPVREYKSISDTPLRVLRRWLRNRVVINEGRQ